MNIQDEIKKTEEGCGKEFIWIKFLQDDRICGQIEDLKHSDHIVLCPICRERLKTLKECEKKIEEEIDKLTTLHYELLTSEESDFDKGAISSLTLIKQNLLSNHTGVTCSLNYNCQQTKTLTSIKEDEKQGSLDVEKVPRNKPADKNIKGENKK